MIKVRIDVDELWPVYFIREPWKHLPNEFIEIPEAVYKEIKEVQEKYDKIQAMLKEYSDEFDEKIESTKNAVRADNQSFVVPLCGSYRIEGFGSSQDGGQAL